MRRKTALALALAAGLLGASARRADACLTVYSVPGTAATLQAAVNLATGTILAGDLCIFASASTYPETVLIASITTNNFRIYIETSGVAGSMNPTAPTGSNQAVFDVRNASVTIAGFTITPTFSIPFGVKASSDDFQLIGSTISDGGSNISNAFLSLNSRSLFALGSINHNVITGTPVGLSIVGSSNTVSSATIVDLALDAVDVGGFGNTIANSFVQGGTVGGSLRLINASSTTVADTTIDNKNAGPALSVSGGGFNNILRSTMTQSAGAGSPAAAAFAATSSNTISQSFIYNGVSGDALDLNAGAAGTQISNSTAIVAGGGGTALNITSASGTQVTRGYFGSGAGYAAFLNGGGAQYNSFQNSSFIIAASAGGFDAVSMTANASFNSFLQSYFQGAAATSAGFSIYNGSFNQIVGSTITSVNASALAGSFLCTNLACQDNRVVGSLITNTGPGVAAVLSAQANQNTVSASTLTATSAQALVINGASTNTVSASVLSSGAGTQLVLLQGASSNTLSGVVAVGSVNNPVFQITSNSSGNAVTASFVSNFLSGTGNAGLKIDGGSSWNTVSFSTITGFQGSACVEGALLISGANNNTLTNDYVGDTSGNALFITNSSGNQVNFSTTAAAGVPSCGAGNGVYVGGGGSASNNSFSNSFFVGSGGSNGFYFDAGASNNTVSFSTIAASPTGGNAASVVNTGSNETITRSYIFGGNPANKAIDIGCQGSGQTVSFSTIVYSGVNAAANTNDANTTFLNDLIVNNGLGPGLTLGVCGPVDASGSVVSGSTITAAGKIGVSINNISNVRISGSVVSASTAVFVTGSTGTVVTGNALNAGLGGAGDGLVVAGGGNTLTVGSNTVNGIVAPNFGFLDKGVGPVTVTGYQTIRGDVMISSVAVADGAYAHVFGRDVAITGAGSSYSGPNASWTLDGAANAYLNQRVTYPSAMNLGSLTVNGDSVTFNSAGFTMTAGSLIDNAVALSTLTFCAGCSFNVNNLQIHGQSAGMVRMISSVPGTPWNLNVFTSTVTGAGATDSNASGSRTVLANDGSVTDFGNNVNWGFLPQLYLQFPGQTWTEGVGYGGAPTVETAGVPFPVVVRAVSYSSTTVATAGMPVTLAGTDPGQSPANGSPALTLPLVAGATTFSNLSVRVGEGPGAISSYTARGAPAIASYLAVSSAGPAWWTGLQVVVPSEVPNPGSLVNGGKLNLPDVQIASVPIPSIGVRAVDNFNNLISTIGASVVITGTNSSTATWQSAPQAMAGGVSVFTSTLTFFSTGTFNFSVAVAGGGPSANSAPIAVTQVSLTSPTVHLNVDQSTVTTLGGGLAGYAFDASAINKVLVAVSTIGAGGSRGYFTFTGGGGFTSPVPVLTTATLQGQGAYVNWSAPVPDGALADKTSYYVEMRAVDASNNVTVGYATFTFNSSLLNFGGNDGEGTAFVLPTISSGCEPVIATVTFTVGVHGILPGGGVAVQLPQNWTAPGAVAAVNPPGVGFAYLASTNGGALSGASVSVGGSPISGQPGGGWISVTVPAAGTAFNPGDKILFTVSAIPPLGPSGRGTQRFSVVSQGAGSPGSFQPIAAQPSIILSQGTTAFIAFADPSPLGLGPLQTSTTMQLEMTDLCGNLVSTNAVFGATITVLGSNSFGLGVDTNAVVYSSAGVPRSYVNFPVGSSLSNGFYYETSTSGVTYELIQATAGALGMLSASYAEANRSVNLLVSSLSLTNVSVDNGTVTPGQTKAFLSSPNSAFIRFSPSVSGAPWSVIIATDPVSFSPARFVSYGLTDVSHPVSVGWNGADTVRRRTPEFLPGGTYYVLIQGANGAVRDASLQIVIPPSPFVAGKLGAAGAAAQVSVVGPGAGFANSTIATATGYFQVFGLVNGQYYAVQASTAVAVGGELITLTTGAVGVQASVSPGLQNLTFPTPAFLRVSVNLPQPAPRDFTGSVKVFNSSGAVASVGSLHYPAGVGSSDDGAQAFGQQASTWTILAVAPDTYTVQIDLPDVRLSTQIAGVLLAANATVDEALSLPKKANVYGFAVLPATTSFGAPVSIEAGLVGISTPSVFGGTFVQPFSAGTMYSSGPYVLYGLDPGTWTITAKAIGFNSASTVVAISSNADVGDPTFATGGLVLTLSTGGAISGSITVPGDSSGVSQCIAPNCSGVFDLAVQAYNLGTFANAGTVVRFAKDPVLTQSTFTLGGLASGRYLVSTSLNGFVLGPAGGQLVTVSTPAVASAALTLTPTNAAVHLNIQLPPLPGGACHPAADFKKIGFSGPGPNFGSLGYPDITKLPSSTDQIFCSSMTVVTPPQLTGFAKYQLVYAPTGAQAIKTVSVSANRTAVVDVDLSVATFTVSGKASFSGSVALPVVVGASTYTVSVSTLGGILQFAPTDYFCLITSTDAQPMSAMHMELIPLDPNNPSSAPGLKKAPTASGLPPFPAPAPNACGIVNPESAAGDLSIMGYLAAIQPDGSFSFPGVAAGDYLLRNAPDLDLNPADGNEIGYNQQFVRVTTTTAGIRADLNQGFAVSGLVILPAGMTTSRMIMLSLKDSLGNAIASVPLGFNAAHAASFVLPNVANGVYSLEARDFGFPTTFVARPLAITVAGQSLLNQNVQMQVGGNITASLAIQQVLADGSKQFVLITPQNKNLLPAGLTVDAMAQPWFEGGFFHANSPNCGLWGCTGQDTSGLTLDANGKLQIQDVLPGSYNVEFTFPNGAGSGASGGLALVSTVKSGVAVAPGETVNLGVVSIVAGASLSGQVTDVATSTPLANVTMTARPSVQQPGQTSGRAAFLTVTTDQSGRYTLAGLDPGVRFYDIYAADRDLEAQGAASVPYEQQVAPAVDIQSTATLSFALAFASFSVSGQVAGFAGDQLLSGQGQGRGAVPGATIFIQKVGVVPTKNPIADVQFQTDADGNFTIPDLTAGSYRLYVTALGYGTYSAGVTIANASVALGTIQLSQGAAMFGSIRKPDGTLASEDEAQKVVGATADLSDFFFGLLTRDPITRGITGYRLAGFKPGLHYRLMFISADNELSVPTEASDVVFLSSSEVRNTDVIYRPRAPYVTAKAARVGADFKITLRASQPLRERLLGDDNLAVMLSTYSAQGFVSSVTLSLDRRELTALYTPGVSESSFTLRLQAYSAIKDPDSSNPVNPEFVVQSTPTFYIGSDGTHRANLNNAVGGALVIEGDQSRVTLPKGAFSVDASSALVVVFQKSADTLNGSNPSAVGAARVEANIRALRFPPPAYPSSLFQAMAALPPSQSPFSGFYDVLLPLGIRTALSKPVQMTISYSTDTAVDPAKLNLYWFNAAANAYILQQDVTGAPPVIDTVNHTITINVNHFSTFVLFNTGVSVITGATFGGSDITAYNFPNPFDLSTKQVSTIHGGGSPSVRGTMISIGLPLDVSGEASIRIFDVAGERVRSLDLGSVVGGNYYYQAWDGRNDSGRDVASGVYIGQVKVGGKSKFFKMALIK